MSGYSVPQGRSYFVQDYTSAALRPQTLWHSPAFKNTITLHPIKQPQNLYAVHHFFLTAQANLLLTQLEAVEEKISSVCEKIPKELAPPWQIMPSCSTRFCSGEWTRIGVATHTTPFTVATKLPKILNPHSVYELVPWEHFTTATKHSTTGLTPEHGLYDSFHSEIVGVVGLIEHHLNSVRGARERRVAEVVQGYTRFSEEVGREYILDLMLVETEDESSVQNERFRLIRPLGINMTLISEATPTNDVIVNIILPVSEVNNDFSHFMEWYYRTTLQSSETYLHLILCIVGDTQTLSKTQRMVANLTRFHPTTRTTILSGTSDLSLAGSLELGASVLNGRDLLFLADTGLRVRQFFFDSCRANTLLGRRVYFPIPYVMLEEPSEYPGPGQWGLSAFASACIHKSDFINLSGSTKSLLERVSESGLEVFQAPDPGLIRVGGVENCEGAELDGDWEVFCRDYVASSRVTKSEVDYLYHHDQIVSRKSLSFVDL